MNINLYKKNYCITYFLKIKESNSQFGKKNKREYLSRTNKLVNLMLLIYL